MKTNPVHKAPPGPRDTEVQTELQRYGTVVSRPIALNHKARVASVESLNQILADTMTLRDMYKKHHWQVSGPDFYQLHLLFDKHYGEQAELVDSLAERVQTLGGVAVAMAPHVAEITRITCPPRGREDVSTQLFRLLESHETIIDESRRAARAAADSGDDGTNDLLISDVIRTNEFQVWFISEQNTAAHPPEEGPEIVEELTSSGRNSTSR